MNPGNRREKHAMIFRQLGLFPESSIDTAEFEEKERLADRLMELNAVDEMVIYAGRFQRSREYIDFLRFVVRFPNYSAYNCFLLYIQNPAINYVATARTWLRKFNRQIRRDARPLIILAPMAPVRFVFDISDTEGSPAPADLLTPSSLKAGHLSKVYENTLHNCAHQGIMVRETKQIPNELDVASRVTPALRKKFADLRLNKDCNYLVILSSRQSLDEKYAALVYELGHIFCGHLGIDSHAWWNERKNVNTSGEEIEVGSVAALVCQRSGLPAPLENYLSAIVAGDQEMPFISLNAVLQAINYIEQMGKSSWSKPRKRSRYE